MPEPHPGAELHQARVHRGRRRLNRDAQPPGRPPDQRQVAVRFGRRQQQQPPGLRRAAPPAAGGSSPRSAPTAAPRRAARTRPPAPRATARAAVPAAPAGCPASRPRSGPGPAHRSARPAPSPAAPARRSRAAPRLRAPAARPAHAPGFAGREDQPDRVGGQPPGHEPQRLRGRLIQPLLVVDQADQRLFPGHLRQQAQHGQPDQEPVRRRPGGQAERGPQRIALRHRQLPGAAQHRRAQLMQARERQLHLRLHAHHACHPAPVRPPGQVIQQRGLTHARVATHHQGPALASPDRLDEPVQRVAFAAPVLEPGCVSPGH